MTIAEIQAAVAERYGVTVAELVSADRRPQFARPRALAMLLAHNLTPKSQEQIGRAFGRSQQRVQEALVRTRARLRDDEDVCVAYHAIKDRLEAEAKS